MNDTHKAVLPILAAALFTLQDGFSQQIDTLQVNDAVSTTAVIDDADDPAIWLHPTVPDSSLIIGTDKGTFTEGGLYVWNMDGSLQQYLALKHPNNVDVRYGLRVAGESIDIAAVSMRTQSRIRIFKIDSWTRHLVEVTADQPIFVPNLPYGLTMYRRPNDGAIFAFVSSKHPDYSKKVVQVRLYGESDGLVHGRIVRELGVHQEIIEGMVVDDELGYLYCAESDSGIHKYYADPAKTTNRIAYFANEASFNSDRKGLALYNCGDSSGYLLVASPDDHSVKVYPRRGPRNAPHQHQLLAVLRNPSNSYGVGLDASSRPASQKFLRGLMVWHDEDHRTFRLYAWEKVAQEVLTVCPETSTAVADDLASEPIAGFTLVQNYPNPFSRKRELETEIRFQLTHAGWTELRIYNLLGQPVRTLAQGVLPAGAYGFLWDGRAQNGQDVSAGIYFYQLRHEGVTQMRKMTVVH